MTQIGFLRLAGRAFRQLRSYITVAQEQGVEKGLVNFIRAYRSNPVVRKAATPYLLTSAHLMAVYCFMVW